MNYGFREAYLEYFESRNFSRDNTSIDVSVFMVDLRIINMSSECEYDWYWKISACSREYEVSESFASLTRQQISYSGSAGWYFRYQSVHIQITYTYWCPTQFSYQMMFMSFNINITGVTGGAGTASLFGTPEVTPGLNRGSCNSGLIFNVVFCSVL